MPETMPGSGYQSDYDMSTTPGMVRGAYDLSEPYDPYTSGERSDFNSSSDKPAIEFGGYQGNKTYWDGVTPLPYVGAPIRSASGFNQVNTPASGAYGGGGGTKKTSSSQGIPSGDMAFAHPGAAPSFVAPTYTAPGPYVAPAWNERRVAYQTQKAASPYLSEIRRSIRQAISRSGVSGNPIIQKYAMGGAMDAAGDNFGKVMGQAGDIGLKNYTAEYGRDLNAYNMNYAQTQDVAKTNYQAKVSEAQANFNAQLAAFQAALKAYYNNPASTGSPGATAMGNP
jgi:hypothetical protein